MVDYEKYKKLKARREQILQKRRALQAHLTMDQQKQLDQLFEHLAQTTRKEGGS